jgi:hypothetical protein
LSVICRCRLCRCGYLYVENCHGYVYVHVRYLDLAQIIGKRTKTQQVIETLS